jgi:hypothetical protein
MRVMVLLQNCLAAACNVAAAAAAAFLEFNSNRAGFLRCRSEEDVPASLAQLMQDIVSRVSHPCVTPYVATNIH